MRRSLARRAIAFTSASVGRRSISRSVSRTQGLASRNVGGGISCGMARSCYDTNKKRRPVSRLPLGAFSSSAGSTGPGGLRCVHRLLGCTFGHRNHRHERAAVGFGTGFDMALDLGEQSMVGAHADIKAGMPGGAALTRNDVAGNHALAAKRLDPEPLARRITTVTR